MMHINLCINFVLAGGSFVIKMFTMFEDSTVCLMFLLNQLFGKVHVFKPSSSKSGNSEVYVICLNYKGTQNLENLWESLLLPYKSSIYTEQFSMFHLNEIPHDFIEQIIMCSEYFMLKQMSVINENIKWFKKKSLFETAKISYVKTSVAACYINKYKINTLPINRKIMPSTDKQNILSFYQKQWNSVNKWCFKEDYKILFVPNMQSNNVNDMLQIKIGKNISTVLHSNFCCKENLNNKNYYYSHAEDSELYDNASKFITEPRDLVVFSLAELDRDYKQYELQKKMFFWLKDKIGKRTVLFVRIPLLTNFLVQLIFLYMSVYEKVVFHRSGFIMLDAINHEGVKEVSKFVDAIQSVYNTIGAEKDVDLDILELIPLTEICNNPLYISYVWNYNNAVFEGS